MAIAFAGITGAEGILPPVALSPTGPQAEVAEDWSQTYLFPEPALREQIERTKAFLDTHAKELDGELFHLKSEGFLDRRNVSKIRSALEHVRGSIFQLTEGIEADQKIDGRVARMVSFELGMAADTLARQANEIDAELNTGPASRGNAPNALLSEVARSRHLIKTLREGSNLVKDTAQAIVRYLGQHSGPSLSHIREGFRE